MEPKLLLPDEITSALDPALVGEVLAFAREISDAVLFIDGGRIQVAGPPREVLVNPTHERLKSFLPEHSWETAL